MKLILGSQSPRRRELLGGLDVPFSWVKIDTEESYPSSLSAEDIPIYISREKADAYAEALGKDEVLITSDTIVWFDGSMLGKPKDNADAKRMLSLLSGKTHQVYTAVCFTWYDDKRRQQVQDTLCDKTDVTFRDLSNEEIDYYVDNYNPTDKAGAYGIQEWIGYVGVTRMEGSYFNVMGFPIERVYMYLKENNLLPN